MLFNIPDQLINFITANGKTILNIIVLILFTWLSLWVVRLADRRWKANLEKPEIDIERQARLLTVENVIVTSLRALVITIAIFTLLGLLGFNLAPLLASAGIAGLAISLGAQTLIKDFIGGFLIVWENQFGVGDMVSIGDVTGTVEKITLRSVSVREYSGKLSLIPNGDIRVVSNLSRQWMRSTVDVYVPFDADVGAVVAALDAAMQEAQNDKSIHDYLLEPPSVSGWNNLKEWGVQIRMTARVEDGKQYSVEGIFRQYALDNLRKQNIQLAIPGQDIYIRSGTTELATNK
jgi:small-conductance mechanosensitive channel